MSHRDHSRRAARCAFTIIEAIAALALMAMCGLTVLMGLSAAVDTTSLSVEQTIAQGMAQELLDEIAGQRYAETDGVTALGPEAGEQAPPARDRFDDIDDYHNYGSQPPVDVYGVPLGQDDGAGGLRPLSMRVSPGTFSRWRQKVHVAYASEVTPSVDLSNAATSKLKSVTVRIEYHDSVTGWRELAKVRRVFAQIPTPATSP